MPATVCGVEEGTRTGRALAALALAAGLLLAGCGSGETEPSDPVLGPDAVVGKRPVQEAGADPRSNPRVVQLEGAGAEPGNGFDPSDDAPSPGAQSDSEVRAELRAARRQLASFKRHLSAGLYLATGPQAKVLPDGTAQAPDNAPEVVQRVILAANQIAKFPYKWGGGHGAWRDSGYDCSGSVSFALAGAGLLDRPLDSSGFLNFGQPGEGEWITIYTNPGHMFMVVAGLRFDTSGQGRAGTRWQQAPRSIGGFAVRHLPGL
jgi:hypothetical protein